MAAGTELPSTLFCSGKEQESRWRKYFKDVLNRPPLTVKTGIQEAESDLSPSSKQDIITAILVIRDSQGLAKLWVGEREGGGCYK